MKLLIVVVIIFAAYKAIKFTATVQTVKDIAVCANQLTALGKYNFQNTEERRITTFTILACADDRIRFWQRPFFDKDEFKRNYGDTP